MAPERAAGETAMKSDRLRGLTGLVLLRLGNIFGLWKRYERWLDPLIRARLARRPGTFLDVGVHVGQTMLKVKRISPATPYIGFEPNPVSFFHAREMKRVNRLENCRLIPVALAATSGLAPLFHRGGDTDSAASLVSGFRDASFYSGAEHVALVGGDAALEALRPGPVSIIKIDVEGGELEVLEGLRETLRRQRPVVICELLPVYGLEDPIGIFRKDRQDRIERILAEENYRIVRIGRDGSLQPLERLEIHSDLTRCDHAFLPGEEAEALLAEISSA